jgi:autotransporter adhesin
MVTAIARITPKTNASGFRAMVSLLAPDLSAATATGQVANATGANATATGRGSLANGDFATATGQASVANGGSATATGRGIGNGATATGSIAMGAGASAANGGAAFGDGAVATGTNATAIGPGASATFANSGAFGAGASATAANQMAFGTASNTYRMPGITSAASLAAQSGPTSFVTTDAAGNLAATGFSPQQMVQGMQSMAQGMQSMTQSFNQLSASVSALQTQVEDVDKRARRGIAAAAAISSIPVVLLRGQTSLTVGSGFYRDAGAVSVSLTHRLNTAMPIYLQGGYSNGGGTENVGRVAASIVW